MTYTTKKKTLAETIQAASAAGFSGDQATRTFSLSAMLGVVFVPIYALFNLSGTFTIWHLLFMGFWVGGLIYWARRRETRAQGLVPTWTGKLKTGDVKNKTFIKALDSAQMSQANRPLAA